MSCSAKRASFCIRSPIVSLIAVGPVRNCEKSRSGFCAGFFSSSGGNHQAKVAEGHLDRFPRLRSFHRPPLPMVLSFCFFFFLVKIRTFCPKVFARIAYKRRSTAGAAWSMAGFLPRASPDSLAPCDRSDPIPPQHRELVQRISPVVHSVPSPRGHDVFQGHVEQLQCRLFARKRSPRLDDLA